MGTFHSNLQPTTHTKRLSLTTTGTKPSGERTTSENTVKRNIKFAEKPSARLGTSEQQNLCFWRIMVRRRASSGFFARNVPPKRCYPARRRNAAHNSLCFWTCIEYLTRPKKGGKKGGILARRNSLQVRLRP